MALKPGQRKCVETLDRPIVVAAGAGSGKTFTLTKRIVGALESGYIDDIGQVCAITFTNKAAAELKSRVKAELRACGLVEQSLKADDAWISTIHGMCARILRSHALELDIDPAFQMGDELKLERLRAESVDEVLREARELAVAAGGADGEAREGGEAAAPVSPAAASGTSAALGARGAGADDVARLFDEYPARSQAGGTSVEDMLGRLMELAGGNLRGADAFKLPGGGGSPSAQLQAAAESYAGLIAAAEAQRQGDKRDAWLASAHEALDAAESALAAGAVDGPLGALALLAAFGVSRGFGTKEFKEAAAACIAARDEAAMRLRLEAAAPHLRVLVGLADAAIARFSAKKRREGLLGNDDLLVFASRALAEHPDIAACYADRFRLVMVDEFQDTDQMQVDMIRAISGPGACRLCTVGDAQQSIYRFRGADVSVYRRHLESVRGADEDGVIVLADNFRSHPDVLALVDRVFSRQDMFGGEFMHLEPGRDESRVERPLGPDEPRVSVRQVTKASRKGASSEEVVAEQAREVARVFARYRAAGHPAGDMAVLLGRMKNAGVYARALRAEGFACVVSGGSVFRETPEARAVLDLARVAVNAADTDALYRVLAGPLFRVSDDDLLALATGEDSRDGLPARRKLDAGLRALGTAIRRAARGGDAESGAPARPGDEAADAFARSCSNQARCAARVLGELQRAAASTALSRALMRAIVGSGWVSRLEARGPEGLAGAANAYKAVRMVEDIEADSAAGPVGVLFAFERMLDEAKEAPGALSARGGDFVRIMTVHASKGLEFPIVAVSEFKEPRASSSALLALDAGADILLSLDLGKSRSEIGGAADGFRPADTVYPLAVEGCEDEPDLRALACGTDDPLVLRAALAEYDQVGDEEEAKRLLYVALTRAKEALVVSMSGTRTKDNPNGVPKGCMAQFAAALAGNADGFDAGATSCDFGGARPADVRNTPLEEQDAPAGASPEAADAPGAPGEGSGQTAAGPADEPPAAFAVPAPQRRPYVLRVRHVQAHEGIFSYSSVADAAHAAGLPARLAERFAVSCDAADPDPAGLAPERPDEAGFFHRQLGDDRMSAVADDDDGSWAYLGSDCHDADKATDFGTAFHRLAQYAALHRPAAGALVPPPASRVRGLMRACGLDGRQWSRLDDALGRWFGSDEAAEMAAWPRLDAEVPFFIAIPAAAGGVSPADAGAAAGGDAGTAFLEGEIDLLALSDDGARARVVDYKTGGRADEAEEALRAKHVLQACCYAYALLRQGVREVEASFVRVERPRLGDSGQPQRVRYAFRAEDAPVLERAIARAWRLAREG